MISQQVFEVKPNISDLGPINITATIEKWIGSDENILSEIKEKLVRYFDGDWGGIGTEDWMANSDTLKRKTPHGRLMASYLLRNGETVWIITDGYGQQENGIDYCYTTILSPDDY